MMDALHRSTDDRMVAGVAGGMAELWDLDPSVVRLAWVILTPLTGGVAIIVYIVLAIVVPQDPIGGQPRYAPPSTAPGGIGAPAGPGMPPGPEPAGGPRAPGGPAGPVGQESPGQAGWVPGAATWRDQRREEKARHRKERAAWRAQRRAARGGRPEDTAIVAGVVLILIGAVAFASQVLPSLDWGLAWPIGLIVLGGVLIARSASRGDQHRP